MDSPLREDQNGYNGGPNRSSGTKVMTSSEMHVLTPDLGMARNITKMASNVKVLNMKVLRLVETKTLIFESSLSEVVCNIGSENNMLLEVNLERAGLSGQIGPDCPAERPNLQRMLRHMGKVYNLRTV